MEEKGVKVGFISLGCPKAVVDAEHIVGSLDAQGVDVVDEHSADQVVVVNTCGFVEEARSESFEAIQRVIDSGREVVVSGCLGVEKETLLQRFPGLKFVSGPAQVTPVVDAVQSFLPAQGNPQAEARIRLTPRHYSYLKISEGCNHTCTFCIIPQMRGPLHSRDIDDVLREAHDAVEGGAKELLVIAQDLSAYGVDLRYRERDVGGKALAARLEVLCTELGSIAPWVRLHYVYPYPSVDRLIPLMASGSLLPYLDVPLQHASPRILKAMRRPAHAEKTLERIRRWREVCPDLAIRSTFIVGFPGETDEDMGLLLDFLEEAQLDRVGCFAYSPVEGAAANELSGHVDEADKLDRQERVYEVQAEVSARRLDRLVGRTLEVLVDESGDEITGRTWFDAPEIDGTVVFPRPEDLRVSTGDLVRVDIDGHDDHDLTGVCQGHSLQLR